MSITRVIYRVVRPGGGVYNSGLIWASLSGNSENWAEVALECRGSATFEESEKWYRNEIDAGLGDDQDQKGQRSSVKGARTKGSTHDHRGMRPHKVFDLNGGRLGRSGPRVARCHRPVRLLLIAIIIKSTLHVVHVFPYVGIHARRSLRPCDVPVCAGRTRHHCQRRASSPWF